MNKSELIRKLREDLLDDVPDVSDPGDDDYLWSDRTLSRYLSEAQDEACRRADLIFDATTDAFTDVSLVDGTATYALNAKITKIVSVKLDNEPLARTTRFDLDRNRPFWEAHTSGDPMYWFYENGSLTLYPKPDATAAAKTCTVAVYRLPQADLALDSDTPEIPAYYHPHLCYYAAYLAFLRPDEDSQNAQRAPLMLQMFDAVFGRMRTALADELLKDHGDDIIVRAE